MLNSDSKNKFDYWDQIYQETKLLPRLNIWRAYMQQLYLELITKWIENFEQSPCLKTDLFEEAITEHNLLSLFPDDSVGLDCSLSISNAAYKRLTKNQKKVFIINADLRSIPLANKSIKHIFSGSSLDHFQNKLELEASLKELARILSSEGTLVLTLDNPHNPVVWLRNKLPFKLLNKLGLVPYYVGATLTRQELCKYLKNLGLEIQEITAISHVPRAPAIWLVSLLEKLGIKSIDTQVRKIFLYFEKLNLLPTRYLTGYYLAVKVIKPVSN